MATTVFCVTPPLNGRPSVCSGSATSPGVCYQIRRSFQLHGADGLIERLPGAKGPHPNQGLSRSRRRSFVWARLYTSKMPVTAVQILNNHALPFFEDHGVKVQTILSDNGREYCGRPDRHPYGYRVCCLRSVGG